MMQFKPAASLTLLSALCCLAVVVATLVPGLPAAAQLDQPTPLPPQIIMTGKGWTAEQRIPGYNDGALTPIIIADQNGVVHSFASIPLSDDPADPGSQELGISYRQWTPAGGWTKTNDIVLTPLKQQARLKGVYLDPSGVFHLVFFGGDDNEANIYYTWAPATLAASAQAWAPLTLVGPRPITPDVAGIVGDGDGHLVIVYSGNLGEGNSLYAVYSDDGGGSWSDPALIYSTFVLDKKPFDFQLLHSDSGRTYLAWNVTDKFGQNVMGYFSKLDDVTSRAWTEPIPIDNNIGLGIANTALFEYNDRLFLFYNNGLPGQVSPVIWYRSSTDGGSTFDQPIRPFPDHIGRNGPPAFAVDSNGTLYVYFGERIGAGFDGKLDLHGMWYSIWNGNSFGPVLPVSSGPVGPGFDPSDPAAAVVLGNLIFLVWRTDPGRELLGTFYASTQVDAPALAPVPLPTPAVVVQPGNAGLVDEPAAPESTPVATLFANPGPVVEPTINPQFALEARSEQRNPGLPIVFGLVPVALLTGIVLAIALVQRRRHLL